MSRYSPAEPSPKGKGSLLPRILTAVALIPVVLAATLWTDVLGVWALACAVAVVAMAEASVLLGGPLEFFLPAVLLLIAAPFAVQTPAFLPYQAAMGVLWLLATGLLALRLRSGKPGKRLLDSLAAGIWCSAPMAMLVLLHSQFALPGGAWSIANPLVLLFLPLWAGDTAAFFVGRAWGRHPLSKISPKKTWEGAIANLVASILIAVPLAFALGYTRRVGFYCGTAVGIAGQVGDLYESFLKRRVGAKDSGTLLPGHGGVLDRIDSLLFAAPAVALIFALAGRR